MCMCPLYGMLNLTGLTVIYSCASEILGLKTYLFFPYPYAINAMREALFGLYGHNMAVYLAQLSVFAGVGLLAWLGIRRPNAGLLRFMEEEMEETGVL